MASAAAARAHRPHRSHRQRHSRLTLVRLLTALALALLSLPLLAQPASADVIGGFEVDGNQVPSGAVDWTNVGDVDVVHDPVGNGDTSVFDSGDSEADNDGVGAESPWGIGPAGTASGKSDIGNILVTDFKLGGSTYAAFAWDRAGDTGTGRYYIELNQTDPSGVTPNRTAGDVRIIVGINGSDLLECTRVETWAGKWTNAQACSAATFKVVVNSATIADHFSSPNAPLEKNTFLEGVLNLSALGLTSCPVTGFKSIHLRSQEGGENGDTSRLKDFGTGAITIDSDCGSLQIKKNVVGGDGTGQGAVFQISPNPTPGAAANPPLVVTTGADGTFTVPAAKPGDYTVRELAPPTGGYLLPASDTKTVTVPPGDPGVVSFTDVLGDLSFTKSYQGDNPTGSGATFTVTRTHGWSYDISPAGGPFDAPSADDIADESFDVTDNGARDTDPDMGQISVAELEGGKYTLVEKSAPAGWEPAAANTAKAFSIGPSDIPAQRSVNLNSGGDPATFSNLRRPIGIKVVKTESVPGIPGDTKRLPGVTFSLYADDGDQVAELGGQDALVSSQVTDASGEIAWSGLNWQRDYWLKETKKAGYQVGLSPNPKLVDLDQADPPTDNTTVVSVDVDNPREEVSIKLHKTGGLTQGDELNGGAFDLYRESNGTPGLQTGSDTKVNAASLALTGSELTFGKADYDVPWGYTYYVHEKTAPTGYALMTPNPITVTPTEADADTTIRLEAVDPRLPVHLTLVKVVDNGTTDGTATVSDFPLTATGPTTISGVSGTTDVTHVEVDPGSYTLSESNVSSLPGYSASSWACVGNGDSAGDGKLTLALGDDVTCTITNTAEQGTYDVVKTADPATGSTVEGGDVITYTVTVTKTGGVDSTDVHVTDDLSDVLGHADLVPDSITTSTGTATLNGTDLQWTIPVLSGTDTLTYQVTVQSGDDDLGVTLRNHVTSPGSSTCPPNARAEAADCTTVHYTPHYTLAKSSDPASGSVVDAGSDVVYTLTVHNDSDAVLAGAVVTDDLSGVVGHTSDPFEVSLGASYSSSDEELTWYVPTLQPDASATVSYTVTIDADAWGVTIGNVATPDTTGDCVTVGGCSTEHLTPHWVLSKTSDPASGTVDAGTDVTYTLRVDNDSAALLSGATVTDDLSDVLDDADVQEPLAPGLALDDSDPSAPYLTWTVPDVVAGGFAEVSYTVHIHDDAWGATIGNVATPDQPSGECEGTCTTEHNTPHWTLTKNSVPTSGSSVAAGTDVTYTLTAVNDSEADLTGATVTDDLSHVLDNASIDVASLDASLAFDDTDPAHPVLVWSVPDLGAGDHASVSYTVHIDDDAWGVTIGNVATPDQPSGECEGTCTTTHLTPHYTLEKTSSPVSGSVVDAGSDVTYSLKVVNDSDAVLSGAVVTDDLSDVVDDASDPFAITPGAAYDAGTETLVWNVPTLSPGAEATVSYTVTLDADAWGVTLVNVATPDDAGDCVTAEGCRTEHVTPHWTLAKNSNPASGSVVDAGTSISYTLTATNDSDAPVSGATVTDDLSAVLNHASLDEAALDPSLTFDDSAPSHPVLVWAVPDLAPGASAQVSYSVRLDSNLGAVTVLNVATPDQPSGDCVGANQCSTSHTTVLVAPTEAETPPHQPQVLPAQAQPAQVLPATGLSGRTELLGVLGALATLAGLFLLTGVRSRRERP